MDDTRLLVPGNDVGSAQLDTPPSRGGLRSGSSISLWQRGGNRLIGLNRLCSAIPSGIPGAAPGLDVKRHQYDGLLQTLQADVSIKVVDYSSSRVEVDDTVSNANLAAFLQRPRPAWSKVRWINCKGISWDVIHVLAQHFELHPLAVEDIVHIPQRVKADFYKRHLFVSLIIVAIEEATLDRQLQPTSSNLRKSLLSNCSSVNALPEGLTSPLGKEIMTEQASFFLMRDGTLLSFFQEEAERMTEPILDRLQYCNTLLSESEDAGFLLNCIVDSIVDHAGPVVDLFSEKIQALETKVLSEIPVAAYTKELYLIQSGLHDLKRVLYPVQFVLTSALTRKDQEQQPYISDVTREYLHDVMDHVLTIAENIDMLVQRSQNLIELIFNTISHHSNRSMQTLAVVSTIFLPVTFIAGVYGTNFDILPELHWHNGYLFFWGTCCIITVIFLTVLVRSGLLSN